MNTNILRTNGKGRNSPQASSERVVLHTRVVTETGGGPEKTILNSPRFLKYLGYRCLCAYMHTPGDEGFEAIQQRARTAEASLMPIPDGGALDLSVVRRLLKTCREEDVSIWHAHDYKSNALGILLRQFHPMKLVTTVHGWVRHTKRTPFYYWLDRRCLRWYDHVICVSEDLRDECLRVGVRRDRLSLIDNAIDTQMFRRRHTAAQAKSEQNFSQQSLLVGAVGRLSEEKGFDRLIRVTHDLATEGLPIQTIVVGDGTQREALQSLVDQLQAQEHVQILGYRSDVMSLFEAMDVFALSSLREGLPNVVLEAMAMEVPVISTRVAGIPNLIRHDENGLLVDIGSDQQLRDGLRRLVQEKELRDRLSLAARRCIEEQFSFQNRMASIGDIYDSLSGHSVG